MEGVGEECDCIEQEVVIADAARMYHAKPTHISSNSEGRKPTKVLLIHKQPL